MYNKEPEPKLEFKRQNTTTTKTESKEEPTNVWTRGRYAKKYQTEEPKKEENRPTTSFRSAKKEEPPANGEKEIKELTKKIDQLTNVVKNKEKIVPVSTSDDKEKINELTKKIDDLAKVVKNTEKIVPVSTTVDKEKINELMKKNEYLLKVVKNRDTIIQQLKAQLQQKDKKISQLEGELKDKEKILSNRSSVNYGKDQLQTRINQLECELQKKKDILLELYEKKESGSSLVTAVHLKFEGKVIDTAYLVRENEKFSVIEKKLIQDYPECKGMNLFYMPNGGNGLPVDKEKTIKENELIQPDDKVILIMVREMPKW